MKLKTLIIILIVLVVALGVIFYFLRRSTANNTTSVGQTGSLPSANNPTLPTTAQNASTTNNVTSTPPSSSSTTFGIVSDDPAVAYFVDRQNNTTLVEPDGVVENITNSHATILSSSSIANIVSANFSYDGKKVLVSFGSANQPQASIFDVTTRSWTPLKGTIQSAAWSPISYQLAYLAQNAAGRESIIVQNAANLNAQPTTLATIAMEDLALQWINKGTLVLADKSSAYTAGSAWLFSIANQTLTPAVLEYPGMESIWSNTTSTVGLVFLANSGDQGGHLNFVTAAGNQQQLTFATLPTKCAFNLDISTSSTQVATGTPSIASISSLDLYCAVPRDQQTFSIARLPDEYNQQILFTADDFYKMNTANGTLTSIFSDQNQNLDATQLKVFNNTLFFVNRYDEKIYAIAL